MVIIMCVCKRSNACFNALLNTSVGLSMSVGCTIDFQDGNYGGHLRFSIGTILVIFDLQVTPILLIKFRVNRPFC